MSAPPATDNAPQLSLSNDDLRNQPQLAAQLLNQAIQDGLWSMVKAILPVYESVPQADHSLVLFAKAGLARSEGDYHTAILAYRTLLTEQPKLNAVRLELARALFENHQYDSAATQFHAVLRHQPPEQISAIARDYLSKIDSKNDIQAGMSLSYVNDSNVNKASSDKYIRIGDRTFIRNQDSYPQRGEGMWFSASIKKENRLVDQHAVRMMATINGNSYWNNHRYDDVTARYYTGYHYSDFRQQWSLLPFYEKRWYGTEAYSTGTGIRGEYGYLLSPVWQWNQVVEYQKLAYDDPRYQFLRGDNWFSSTTLSHAFAPGIALFLGVDILQQKTMSDSESNRRTALRGGAQFDLARHLSLSTWASIAQRQYEGKNDIFLAQRKDHELMMTAAVWNREWAFFSLVPKLNLSYKRVESNITFYQYSQKNIFLTIEKTF